MVDENLRTDFEVRKATLKAMGGDMTKDYRSIYEVDLAILAAAEGGGGGGLTPEQVRVIIEEYNYATEDYVDTKIGDINAALEAIIGA